MDLGTKPMITSQEYWDKLEARERSTIRLFLSDSMLLNVSGEDSLVNIWGKLGSLYQSKSLVKKVGYAKESVSS